MMSKSENILPEEIWEIILEKLTNPQDLHSFSNTCKLFQRLLQPTQGIWYFEQTCHLLLPYMTKSSILTCRYVCKTWNIIIDNATKLNNDFSSESKLKRFLPQMINHPRSPFIGHDLSISLFSPYPYRYQNQEDIVADDFEMWHLINSFLEAFGRHIWTFNFELKDPTGGHPRSGPLAYFILKDLYEFCPNLKCLKLKAIDVDVNVNQSQLGLNALVPPAGLTTLEISHVYSDLCGAILKGLNKCELTSLKIDQKAWLFSKFDWPYLKELHFSRSKYLHSLRGSKFMLPQLEKLILEVDWDLRNEIGEREVFRDIFLVLQSLSLKAPKLNSLSISNNFVGNGTLLTLPDKFHCPPNIKYLVIKDVTDWKRLKENWDAEEYENAAKFMGDFAFLKRFPYVEELQIVQDVQHETYLPEIIEVICGNEEVQVNKYLYCGRMYKSNIWEVMQSLKRLSFQREIYLRKGYEREIQKLTPLK